MGRCWSFGEKVLNLYEILLFLNQNFQNLKTFRQNLPREIVMFIEAFFLFCSSRNQHPLK